MSKDKNYTITVELKLTEEDLGDIICAAFEGGIGYWGCLDMSKPEWQGKPKNMPISQYITILLVSNEEVTIFDTELEEDELTEEGILILNLDKLLAGIKKYLEEDGLDCAYEGNIDTCNIDADAADNIIQYALFGEIVFG